VNLSDLAAKGAQPSGFLLTLALPEFSEEWLAAFARGLGEDADEFGCALLGGDTVRTPGPTSVSIAIIGTVPSSTMVMRAGAKVGDHVLVTGTIGDAVLGLRLLREPRLAGPWNLDSALHDYLVARYRVPQPRSAAAEAIRTHASAAMDVSDGLVGDLGKLCAASGVSAEITVWDIPFSRAAGRALEKEPLIGETLLTGGDDYEVLCTIPHDKVEAFRSAAAEADVSVTDIGKIMAGSDPPRLIDREGRALSFFRPSYSHF
jgi:thiamine-monophosphate kinase